MFVGTFYEEVGRRKATEEGTIKVRVPKKEQPEEMMPELPTSNNRIEFTFAAPFTIREARKGKGIGSNGYPDIHREEAVEYRYELIGPENRLNTDRTWSEWTTRSHKEYRDLAKGFYIFRVKARNIFHRETSTSEYRFKVGSP